MLHNTLYEQDCSGKKGPDLFLNRLLPDTLKRCLQLSVPLGNTHVDAGCRRVQLVFGQGW